MPYVYLIQPAVLVGTNRYKAGMSKLSNLSRLKAYMRGTRHLWICECDDALVLERKIMKEFNSRYRRIAGNEYFEVDCEMTMIQLFVDIVMKHKSGETDPEEEEEKKNPTDWMQRFAYKKPE